MQKYPESAPFYFVGHGEETKRKVLYPRLQPGVRVQHPATSLFPDGFDPSRGPAPQGAMAGTIEYGPCGERRVRRDDNRTEWLNCNWTRL